MTARDLAARATGGPVQIEVGAMVLASTLEWTFGDPATAAAQVARMRLLVAEQRHNPEGALNLDAMDLAIEVQDIIGAVATDGVTASAIQRLAGIRDAQALAGRDHAAYLTTHLLVRLHDMRGDTDAVIDEGIRALGYHTRRATTVPDARERASMRQDVHELAASCFTAAVRSGRLRLAAELLEVLRAQPIPQARAKVPQAERSVAWHASRLLSSVAPALLDWSGSWLPAAADAPVGAFDPDDDAALLLGGLPSIRFPWGPALDDRLRDPLVATVVHVHVNRGDALETSGRHP